jgi:hypothetical protein
MEQRQQSHSLTHTNFTAMSWRSEDDEDRRHTHTIRGALTSLAMTLFFLFWFAAHLFMHCGSSNTSWRVRLSFSVSTVLIFFLYWDVRRTLESASGLRYVWCSREYMPISCTSTVTEKLYICHAVVIPFQHWFTFTMLAPCTMPNSPKPLYYHPFAFLAPRLRGAENG